MPKKNVPSAKELEFLKQTRSSVVEDVVRHLNIGPHVAMGLHPVSPFGLGKPHVAGPAFTIRFLPRRGTGLKHYDHYDVIAMAKAGDVIVAEAYGSISSIGHAANWIAHCMQYGVQAWIADGYMRGIAEVVECEFPVFYRGVTAVHGDDEIVDFNVPVNCAGAQVRAGDIVVADDDGVVVIPLEAYDRVLPVVKESVPLENEQLRLIRNKAPLAEIHGFRANYHSPVEGGKSHNGG